MKKLLIIFLIALSLYSCEKNSSVDYITPTVEMLCETSYSFCEYTGTLNGEVVYFAPDILFSDDYSGNFWYTHSVAPPNSPFSYRIIDKSIFIACSDTTYGIFINGEWKVIESNSDYIKIVRDIDSNNNATLTMIKKK